jgi:hypothetical protein
MQYPADRLYLEPTQPAQRKTITVRFHFANYPINNAAKAAGPILDVQLAGNSGVSDHQRTDDALIFSEKHVSFSVPGNFDVTSITVTLVGGDAPAAISNIGVIVEEALAAEIPFQDTANLRMGGTASLQRYGKTAKLDAAALKDPRVIVSLNGRTAADIFHAIASNQNEISAIDELRHYHSTPPNLISGNWSFDEWFLRSFDENANTLALSSSVVAAAKWS